MSFIDFEVRGPVGVITLDRAERRNAQNTQFLIELDQAWSSAAEDDAVRVIVLRANGPHFSAGHDMSPEGRDRDFDFASSGLAKLYAHERTYYFNYTRRWRDIPKPSIAAVQGMCIAAGLMLCWPCDLIVAAENAYFSDPVIRMGIGGVEYHGHSWELGPRKAKEMLFTAKGVTAQEAERLGMVNRVVPLEGLDDATFALANEIAAMHPFALAMAKRSVNQTLDIMGQQSALQAAFDTHQLGHANALVLSGQPVLANLAAMRGTGDKGQG